MKKNKLTTSLGTTVRKQLEAWIVGPVLQRLNSQNRHNTEQTNRILNRLTAIDESIEILARQKARELWQYQQEEPIEADSNQFN
jgi:hypothetical protein